MTKMKMVKMRECLKKMLDARLIVMGANIVEETYKGEKIVKIMLEKR